jgi:hypothetical protein
MSDSILTLPVSVEQIAVVIKQMSPADQKRLLDLAPKLRDVAIHQQSLDKNAEQIQTNIAHLRTEVLTAVGNQPLSPDDPFLGNLTLGQYLALPDEEKARLWEEWADIDLMELGEQEVSPGSEQIAF